MHGIRLSQVSMNVREVGNYMLVGNSLDIKGYLRLECEEANWIWKCCYLVNIEF